MEVTVNKQKLETQSATIGELIGELFSDEVGIAVALGVKIIPRVAWSQTPICENDSITIIRATRGG